MLYVYVRVYLWTYSCYDPHGESLPYESFVDAYKSWLHQE